MTGRGLGYRPDKPDPRDHAFSAHHAALASVQTSASVDVPHVVPKNQGSTSSCVGNSWAKGLQLSYLASGLECPDLSALYIYRIARNLDATVGDDGSFLRSGARAVQNAGCAPEIAWPFSEARVNDQIPFRAEHAGFDMSGTRRYFRIAAGDTDGVKRAIAAKLAVVGGWDVDDDFVSGDGKTIVDVQDPRRNAGGHAIALIGYDHDTFTLINSWGAAYGINGRFRATKGFVAAGTDLWAIDPRGGVS
jgi:C1A family cysteine protease